MTGSLLDYEFYETPRVYTHFLFREVAITGTVFEPTIGSGAIIQASRETLDQGTDEAHGGTRSWLTNDLDSRWPADWHQDATEERLWKTVSENAPIDWTITNPPFSGAIAILDQALKYSRVGVAMHFRASIHEPLKTGPRRTFMFEHPPTGILWLPRFAYQRSKTTGKWTTDNVCACWVIWMKSLARAVQCGPGRPDFGEAHDVTPPQFIKYAPPWVIDGLGHETKAYRARMDALMGITL